MRDKLRLAILVSVVCLLVAACTGSDSDSGSTSGQGQQAGGAPAAGHTEPISPASTNGTRTSSECAIDMLSMSRSSCDRK